MLVWIITRFITILGYCVGVNITSIINQRELVLVFFDYYKIRLFHLGGKYNLFIPINVTGFGLRIPHLIGWVMLNSKIIGNYCDFNAGSFLGNKNGQENIPIIGDYTAFGPEAKAFGKLSIGSLVFVSPNAVVTKDIPDNCIVGGVPAKIIKQVSSMKVTSFYIKHKYLAICQQKELNR